MPTSTRCGWLSIWNVGRTTLCSRQRRRSATDAAHPLWVLSARPRRRRETLFRIHRRFHFCGETATVAPRAFVLANSISLAPPQAAGLVHCAARPLQTANAALVCCLVPFLSCQKKVCKKEAQENEIALTRRKTSRSIVRVFVTPVVKERPDGRP